MKSRRPLVLILGAVVALAVIVSAGTFVYIHFIDDDAPDALAFSTSTTSPGATSIAPLSNVSGNWAPTPASQVGYRVKEVLFGQSTEAVGRTNKIDGLLDIEGTTVNAVDLAVDMASVTSDKSNRDGQFRDRIMSVNKYPISTFKLDEPIKLTRIPDANPVTITAKGTLTMHGVSKPVTVDLKIRQVNNSVEVNGQIPVKFSDWNIPNPSFGPAQTEDNGLLELLVVFEKKA